MSDRGPIEVALRSAGVGRGVDEFAPMSGGCIHRVYRVRTESAALVAKVADDVDRGMLAEEVGGLTALRDTGTVLVPDVLALESVDGVVVLLMTFLEPHAPGHGAWVRLGRDLAALHGADVGAQYGFAHDNHLGRTAQPNAWADDWVTFNVEQRLGHQRDLTSPQLTEDERARLREVEARLPELLPRRPHPALLHGDLWSGNAVATRDEDGPRIGLLDPAVSIGDGLADLAMMQLFGGFPAPCFDAYRAAAGLDEIDPVRIAIYQLYHVLNHVTLFGRGYAGQAMALARSILRSPGR